MLATTSAKTSVVGAVWSDLLLWGAFTLSWSVQDLQDFAGLYSQPPAHIQIVVFRAVLLFSSILKMSNKVRKVLQVLQNSILPKIIEFKMQDFAGLCRTILAVFGVLAISSRIFSAGL